MREVLHEIGQWLAREMFVDGVVGSPLTEIGRKYLDAWNLLTDNGSQTSMFGQTLQETVVGVSTGAVWGDVQFLWRAVCALYGRPVVVFHDYSPTRPLVFGAWPADSCQPLALPVSLHFVTGSSHYDAVGWHGAFRD